MRYLQIIWDEEDRPDGNVQHIAEHGLTIEDVEYVLENSTEETISKTFGPPLPFWIYFIRRLYHRRLRRDWQGYHLSHYGLRTT